ncbi:hypothetical protein ACTWJ8_39785 (plasmid) [Streptomyces sp. SDT5-1]|uniref:hypothetical protein n=1 Tax=Streptomyces sp. SDT5-1 TaxID=3406418 RepID=UPI003FD34560
MTYTQPQDTNTAPDTVHIVIEQLADGRVSSVSTVPDAPTIEELHSGGIRKTVWQSGPVDDEDGAPAQLVWNPSLTPMYGRDDRFEWENSRARVNAFHGPSAERRALRQVEARLVLAGHLDVHTGTVAAMTHGLTVVSSTAEYAVFRDSEGWHIVDYFMGDWDDLRCIAPPDAGPRRVAAAILAVVHEDEDRDDLRPLARVYLRAAEVAPQAWSALKFHALVGALTVALLVTTPVFGVMDAAAWLRRKLRRSH